jgi:16S rRNA (guanine527-N7)-methyltransferase
VQTLADSARQLDLALSAEQVAAFETYFQELVDWNRRLNLTRITGRNEVLVRHFLDSLSIYPTLVRHATQAKRSLAALELIDVGSGAGFPGLPLKIALPELSVTLLEATGKKAEFLRHLVKHLALDRVAVVKARAEEAGQATAHREQFDVAVARAVARLDTLVELTLPFVREGGLVIAQKGDIPAGEVEDAAAAIDMLRGKLREVRPVRVPGLEASRQLVIIEKVGPTPQKYPRRSGIPAKRPLG